MMDINKIEDVVDDTWKSLIEIMEESKTDKMCGPGLLMYLSRNVNKKKFERKYNTEKDRYEYRRLGDNK